MGGRGFFWVVRILHFLPYPLLVFLSVGNHGETLFFFKYKQRFLFRFFKKKKFFLRDEGNLAFPVRADWAEKPRERKTLKK